MAIKKQKVEELSDNFWEAASAAGKLIPNSKLKNYGRVYSYEPYAEELAKLYANITEIANKEPKIGEVYKIVDIHVGNNNEITVLLSGFIDATINLEQEKKFLQMLGTSEHEFIFNLKNEEGKRIFLQAEHFVSISMIKPYVKVSLYEGQLSHVKKEFSEQISNPTTAYYGKITGKNQGGFIIAVQGIDGFLPGSLAAANIVRDFDTMIGKEIPVMVEDYLAVSDTFVFSYKKYLDHVLPTKIENLDIDKKYTGTITGIAKYGIFVEFDEIFTGLLHSSKMTAELKERFKSYAFSPGMEISFWIKEITADKKIILSDEDPLFRRKELEIFTEQNLGYTCDGEVVSIQPFGALIKLQKDIVGLISQKEIKMKKKRFNIGDNIIVTVDRVHNDKIFLSIPDEN